MERLTVDGVTFLAPMVASKKELCNEIERHQKYYNKLCEYENTVLTPSEIEQLKKENAELKARLEKSVELPCKVGDMVYDMKYGEVNAWKITLISHWGNEIHINSECKVFLPCEFGKNVFLTKEEAEQALKGGNENA